MMFDTLKRKNKAEQEEQEWNANRPADYVSQNKEAMDALTGELGSGYDGDTLAKAYQQYRDQTTDAAAATAENTRANAATLSGGYGSSWADSLAAQGQGAATANVDAALTELRSRALNEYKNRQSGLVEALSGMGNTEALDRSAYGANLSDWYNQQNFLANQSAQARNENDNYWNNLWNGIKNVGKVAMTAYNGYMGYTQQQKENKMQTIQLAMQVQAAGNTELAKAILEDEGIDSSVLDSYTGDKPTWKDQLQGLSTASGLMGDGDVAGARSYLSILGMPVDSITSYDDRTSQAFDDYVNRQTFVRSLSGSGSGSSSGHSSSGKSSGKSSSSSSSSVNNHGYTNAQLLQMSKTYSSMKDSDPQKGYYKQVLTDAGYLKPETASSSVTAPLEKVNPYTPASTKLRLSNTGNHTTQKATSGQPINRAQVAANAAKGQWEKGADMQTIYNSLRLQGYSETEIEQALNALA